MPTFLGAVLLGGGRHWVSCSGKGTHDWQRAWPVIPGPVAGRAGSVTHAVNECQGHNLLLFIFTILKR